ncbi:MAG: hypothetical protein ETSY2_21740 [Candidatus Entotheonella gemina]|uniref:Uncharacterized protein n=1 Tax=Candidatus Entotheonella gemina TaxID=1429439 RepID=W4M7L7_9BACT|nr:MAG: hypothetical protein ETSY2_21740 [Candidatus Entotheonella gemina]
MSSIGQTVQVTLQMPKDMYEQVTQAALTEQQQIEDLLRTLIAEGLEAHTTVRELLEHVSEDYRARLAREGKLQQSSDDVLQELRDLRDQITRELYPR